MPPQRSCVPAEPRELWRRPATPGHGSEGVVRTLRHGGGRAGEEHSLLAHSCKGEGWGGEERSEGEREGEGRREGRKGEG